MLKKTVTYTDFNGERVTEDCYFNLNTAELKELQWSVKGGYIAMLQNIIDTSNGPAIMQTLKEFILKAYGIKDIDGRHFRKSEQISNDFYCSPAYAIIFDEISSDREAAAAFINGVIPTAPTATPEILPAT